MKLLKTYLNAFLFYYIIALICFCGVLHAQPKERKGFANSFESIQNYYQAKEYEKVIRRGNSFLKLYPKDTDVLLYVGYAYYNENQYQEAIDAFTKVLNLSKKYDSIWDTLAQCYINLEQYPQALNVVNNGLTKLPDDKGLLQKKAYLEHFQTKKKKPEAANARIVTTIQAEKPQKPPFPTTEKIIAAYKAESYAQAISMSKQYLNKYPNVTDVQFFLGLSYIKTKQFSLAEKQFNRILQKQPTNTKVRLQLINTLYSQEKYSEIIRVCDQGVATGQNSNLWLFNKAKVYYVMNNYESSIKTLEKINDLKDYAEAKKLYDYLNEITNYNYVAHNEFGLYNSHLEVRNPDQPWDIATLYGLRKNDYGSFGGFVRYQHRPGQAGYQLGLTAQPNITKTTYLDLTYAYSDEPALFANDMIHAEAYQYLPWGLQVSAGDDYRKITNTYLNAYTASIAKTISNFEAGFRPQHFVPKEGPESTLYKLYVKRYGITNSDRQIGLTYAFGQAPDLADLETVNFFKIDDRLYMLTGQEPITPKFLVQYGLGFEQQKFPNGTYRKYYYFNLGAKFRGV